MQNLSTDDLDGDIITDLPVDRGEPSVEDLKLVTYMLPTYESPSHDKHEHEREHDELKLSLLAGILFAVFSIPIMNMIIYAAFPAASASSLGLMLVKTASVTLCFWAIAHFFVSSDRVKQNHPHPDARDERGEE